jgi:predicted Rossmann fold nucleotide-binding protein DprA/Smf involved in DNA uptake
VRNAWIAGLSTRVVIAEAPERSGALHTARAMVDASRDDQLLAVPGPLGAPSYVGCVGLVKAGIRPLVDLDDLVEEVAGTRGPRFPDWLAALFAGAGLDEVARLRDLPTVTVLREVSRLELSGRVVRLPGGRYAPGGAL